MLYLNSIENAEDSPPGKKYAICHEEVPSMRNILELAPSRELLAQWESEEIGWEEFRVQFIEEMRTEYLNGEMSRLKGLAKYALENDVTLHSPEPSGEQTYRSILEGIINQIWESQGLIDRVIDLAREPVEESQQSEHQEDITRLFGNTLHELSEARDNNTQLLRKNDELRGQIGQLENKINTHETTIDDLHQTLSEKEEKISTQEDKIKSLEAIINKLKEQVDQLQDINTHPEIRNIAVKATGNDPVFGEHFRTLDINQNLPVELRRWLEGLLTPSADSHGSLGFESFGLTQAINQHNDFERADNLLAHVIRTQGNLSVHENPDKRTEMGRALCCFFAAALLSPKLPELE